MGFPRKRYKNTPEKNKNDPRIGKISPAENWLHFKGDFNMIL